MRMSRTIGIGWRDGILSCINNQGERTEVSANRPSFQPACMPSCPHRQWQGGQLIVLFVTLILAPIFICHTYSCLGSLWVVYLYWSVATLFRSKFSHKYGVGFNRTSQDFQLKKWFLHLCNSFSSVILLCTTEAWYCILTRLLCSRIRDRGWGVARGSSVHYTAVYRTSVRKQTICGTSGICHYIQTVSNSRKLFPRQTPTLIVIINQSLMDKRRTVQRIYFFSIGDRSKMNYEQLHWLFPILMASDRFEKDNIKDA